MALAAMGVLLLAALALRATVEREPDRAKRLLGVAAAVFPCGTLCWVALVLPRLLDVGPEALG